MKRHFFTLMIFASLSGVLPGTPLAAAETRPNIVVILADDI